MVAEAPRVAAPKCCVDAEPEATLGLFFLSVKGLKREPQIGNPNNIVGYEVSSNYIPTILPFPCGPIRVF